MTITHNLGFPRIGADRELKRSLEAYWQGSILQKDLLAVGEKLRRKHWECQRQAGMGLIPTGDFAWYDQVLTLSATVGNVPNRHRSRSDIDLDTLFSMARGWSDGERSESASAMTKWFNTNYHYLVPEFYQGQVFHYAWTQIVDETKEALALGYRAKPVILGPLSYLWLGKAQGEPFDKLTLLDSLLSIYQHLLSELESLGVEWVQIDEPILSLDLSSDWQQAFERSYHRLKNNKLKVLMATYFGSVQPNLSTVVNLPVAGLHIDIVSAPEQLNMIVDRLSCYKVLSVGLINGRNIWRADLETLSQKVRRLHDLLGERLWLAPSCSLLHCPVDLERETQLPEDIVSWLAFAKQKLHEVSVLADALRTEPSAKTIAALAESAEAKASRSASAKVHDPVVKQRVAAVKPALSSRDSPYAVRALQQQEVLQLPLLPTTTIGSFPQTSEIRRLRRDYKNQQISQQQYKEGIRQHIQHSIATQEALGLDVLVHGEAERNDMVEYFGEQLSGYAFTQYGWVQSYGSRCVKPPIIYGDVSRPTPITVDWISYAQSLTDKSVKGMLTGPVTMLYWSFIRDDQPHSETALQIALALRDEVVDLEKAGIAIIQIDEPALREGLPLRKSGWQTYLAWAVQAFKISACGVSDQTQIHTHMCYSEFNDIIEAIAELDADVITIETSRSNMQLLDAFERFSYPNGIGPGVYDIHSPNIPSQAWIHELLEKAAAKIPLSQLWVNPDCGLKTRGWEEVNEALGIMVNAAKQLRETAVKAESAKLSVS